MMGVSTTMTSHYMVTLLSYRVWLSVFFCNMACLQYIVSVVMITTAVVATKCPFKINSVTRSRGILPEQKLGNRAWVCNAVMVATKCPFVAPFQHINCWVLIPSIYSSSCHRAITLGRTLHICASSGTFLLIGNDIWQKVYRYWAGTNTDCKGASWIMSDGFESKFHQLTKTHGMHNSTNQHMSNGRC